MSRPSTYTAEIGDQVAEILAQDKSIRYAAKKVGVTKDAITSWLMRVPEFCDKCARAREAQALVIYDDLRDIERKVLNGTIDVQAGNVVLGNKRWRAGRANRKHFGDAQKLEHTGADGGPIRSESSVSMTADEAYRALLG